MRKNQSHFLSNYKGKCNILNIQNNLFFISSQVKVLLAFSLVKQGALWRGLRFEQLVVTKSCLLLQLAAALVGHRGRLGRPAALIQQSVGRRLVLLPAGLVERGLLASYFLRGGLI